jgi:glycosyltransferase involved in cell wall biosynthesis
MEHSSNSEDQILKNCRAIALINSRELFGHERGNIEWYNCLKRQGAKITVGISPNQSGSQLERELQLQDYEYFELPFGCQWSKKFFKKHPLLFFKNLKNVIRCSYQLARQVRARKANYILLGNPLAFSYVAPLLLSNRSLKLVYRMGDEPSHDSKPNLAIWKLCFRRANRVVANSIFVRQSIEKAAGKTSKLSLIYNVAPEQPATTELSEPCPSHITRVLYVGQISPHKGVDILVDVAIQICRESPSYRFDILGSSQYTQDFEDTLKTKVEACGLSNRIVFHGHVNNPANFYKSASFLTVPSIFQEPAANVVLEAKRHQCPAIVFPTGGLPELVTNGVTGIVCDTPTSVSLLKAIRLLNESPMLVSKMRDNCSREYETRFSKERFDREWAQVILDC